MSFAVASKPCALVPSGMDEAAGKVVLTPAMAKLATAYSFRRIQACDRDRVKMLHEEWFPVI